MTPLTMFVTTCLRNRARVLLDRHATCVLVCRPRGVLHAYVGPLTRSGRFIPRSARPTCGARTRALGVVPLSEVRDRPVCARCTARLLSHVQEAGHPTRAQMLAAYADVTPFDLALDAWRAESVEDVERVQHAALLLFGAKAAKNDPVVAPGTGKVTGPLDAHIAKAYRRLGISRDPLGPEIGRAHV